MKRIRKRSRSVQCALNEAAALWTKYSVNGSRAVEQSRERKVAVRCGCQRIKTSEKTASPRTHTVPDCEGLLWGNWHLREQGATQWTEYRLQHAFLFPSFRVWRGLKQAYGPRNEPVTSSPLRLSPTKNEDTNSFLSCEWLSSGHSSMWRWWWRQPRSMKRMLGLPAPVASGWTHQGSPVKLWWTVETEAEGEADGTADGGRCTVNMNTPQAEKVSNVCPESKSQVAVSGDRVSCFSHERLKVMGYELPRGRSLFRDQDCFSQVLAGKQPKSRSSSKQNGINSHVSRICNKCSHTCMCLYIDVHIYTVCRNSFYMYWFI